MSDWFNLSDVLAWISQQDSGLGLLLSGAGLICFVFGWRLSRFMIALSLAVMGGVVAGCLAPGNGLAAVVAPVGGAVVAGWLGVRTKRLAVALAAGGWSAVLTLGSLVRLDTPPGPMIVVCAIAFLIVAAISFAAIRPCVAFVTSVEGTILIVVGALILLAGVPSWWVCMRDAIQSNPIFLPFSLLAGTVTGYYVQLADMQEKDTGLVVS